VLGFFDFCKSNNLIDEIQNKQWVRFGERYNGAGAVYGPKLKAAFDVKRALLALPKKPNPPVETVAIVAVTPTLRRAAMKLKGVRSKPQGRKQKTSRAKAQRRGARIKSGRAESKRSATKAKSTSARPNKRRRRVA
jgi:hypothetical protein